ncbi:MAG: hypothetical protein ACTHKZ_07220 [Lysobacteraceae bacterium]
MLSIRSPRPLLPLALSLLAACSTVAGERDVATGQPFDLAPGARVALEDGGSLRYVGLVNDSRCPPTAQCVWAGDAEVAFQWTSASGAASRFSLHTMPGRREHALDARRWLRLVALQRGRAPVATLQVAAAP